MHFMCIHLFHIFHLDSMGGQNTKKAPMPRGGGRPKVHESVQGGGGKMNQQMRDYVL